jgi:hypothetical protein
MKAIVPNGTGQESDRGRMKKTVTTMKMMSTKVVAWACPLA